LPQGTVTLIEDATQARIAAVPADMPLAFITQTTLSVDDTADIVAALRERFPDIHVPAKEDICYATTNRQAAVKAIAGRAELMVVVGAPNSSNSLRLVEVAERAGCPLAVMVQRGRDLDLALAEEVSIIGITAGASAPEVLVDEVLARLRERYTLVIEEVVVAEETVTFKLPASLHTETSR
jgi:4-hydroxy-3-methylbut-2-enyl diphosphate reductase